MKQVIFSSAYMHDTNENAFAYTSIIFHHWWAHDILYWYMWWALFVYGLEHELFK